MNPYKPINCDFHDLLLDRITRGKPVKIAYDSDAGQQQKEVILKDVYTKQKEEFLVMADEEVIRLDQIVRVDDNIRPGADCKI